MKRILLLSVLCLSFASPCPASSCQDVQDVAGTAMQQRNGRITDVYNTLVPDPESERKSLATCLDCVNDIGDAFNLGVTLPDIEQLIEGMCNQVDSLIQQKVNDAHNQVLNSVNGIGGNNPFKVYGTSGEFLLQLKGGLK